MADSAEDEVGCRQVIGFKRLVSERQGDRIEAALCRVDRVRDLTESDRLGVDAPEGLPVFRERWPLFAAQMNVSNYRQFSYIA